MPSGLPKAETTFGKLFPDQQALFLAGFIEALSNVAPSFWDDMPAATALRSISPKVQVRCTSAVRVKQRDRLAAAETLREVKGQCPEDIDIQKVQCGDFHGHLGEYVDWHTNIFWKKWFVACKQDLLFITYNCDHGEKELEAEMVSALLATLRSKV